MLQVRPRCLRRTFASIPRRRDPFAVLGVSSAASLDACKAAFHRLALALHPDVSPTPEMDSAKFEEVVDAYKAIVQGDGVPRRSATLRGVRSVGGVLTVSIAALQRDPDYSVFSVRIQLIDGNPDGSASSSHGNPSTSSDAGALSTERVHEVRASLFDSVADLRSQLEAELELPRPQAQGDDRRRRSSGNELIYRAQLLGEHLFLADYDIRDGDVVHFAVRSSAQV